MIDFKKAEEAFEKYVLKFDLQNENIKMKKDHSYRVEKESYNIAKSLELNEEQVQIAKLVGLLHDIGRFEQITQYSTFVDSKSIDHAEYGVEQLNKNNLIRRFISTNKYDRIINEAIRNHNKYSINLNLNKDEMLQAKIIRDADKLDIMNIYLFKPFYLLYKKEDIGDEKLSDNVYEQILMKKTIKSGTVTSNIDKWIIILAFIYDLNFEYSLKKIRDEKYIEKLIDRIDYKDEQTKKRMEYLKITAIEDINKKINKEERK